MAPPKKRGRRPSGVSGSGPSEGRAPAAPVAPPGPRLEAGEAPRGPAVLPPNPGPRAQVAADLEAEAAALGLEAGPQLEAAPQGLDARAVVELVAETRALAIVLLASSSGARFTDEEMRDLVTLSQARRRSLEATAPAALPYLNRALPNAGLVGLGLFGVVVVGSFVEPLRLIKRRGKEARAAAALATKPPPPPPPPPAPPPPPVGVHALDDDADLERLVGGPDGQVDRWPELGASAPAAPGT